MASGRLVGLSPLELSRVHGAWKLPIAWAGLIPTSGGADPYVGWGRPLPLRSRERRRACNRRTLAGHPNDRTGQDTWTMAGGRDCGEHSGLVVGPRAAQNGGTRRVRLHAHAGAFAGVESPGGTLERVRHGIGHVRRDPRHHPGSALSVLGSAGDLGAGGGRVLGERSERNPVDRRGRLLRYCANYAAITPLDRLRASQR
jgi:hypothetical protein